MMSSVSPVLKVTSLPHRRAEIQAASLRIASYAGLGGENTMVAFFRGRRILT